MFTKLFFGKQKLLFVSQIIIYYLCQFWIQRIYNYSILYSGSIKNGSTQTIKRFHPASDFDLAEGGTREAGPSASEKEFDGWQ